MARVPDTFFTMMAKLSRYDTYGDGPNVTRDGTQLAPPRRVPTFMACQPNGAVLSCQNLNGDANTPVGSRPPARDDSRRRDQRASTRQIWPSSC